MTQKELILATLRHENLQRFHGFPLQAYMQDSWSTVMQRRYFLMETRFIVH